MTRALFPPLFIACAVALAGFSTSSGQDGKKYTREELEANPKILKDAVAKHLEGAQKTPEVKVLAFLKVDLDTKDLTYKNKSLVWKTSTPADLKAGDKLNAEKALAKIVDTVLAKALFEPKTYQAFKAEDKQTYLVEKKQQAKVQPKDAPQDLAKILDAIAALDKHLATLEKTVQSSPDHADALKAIKKQLADLDKRLTDLPDSKKLLEAITASNKRLADMEKSLKATDDGLKNLSKDLKDLPDHTEAFKAINKKLADLEKLRSELTKAAKLAKSITAVEKKLAATEASRLADAGKTIDLLTVFVKRLADMEKELKGTDDRLKNLGKELKDLPDHTETLKGINKKLADLDKLRAEPAKTAKLAKSVADLEKKLAASEASRLVDTLRAIEVQAAFDKRLADMEKRADEKVQKLKNDAEKLDEKMRILISVQAAFDKLLADREKATEEKVRTLKKDAEKLHEKIRNLNSELADLRNTKYQVWCYDPCTNCWVMVGALVALPNPAPEKDAPSTKARAKVHIDVPEGGKLFVSGQHIDVAPGARIFETPPITVGQTYAYDIRIDIDQDGQRRSESRRVTVQGGADVRVSFLAPAPGSNKINAEITPGSGEQKVQKRQEEVRDDFPKDALACYNRGCAAYKDRNYAIARVCLNQAVRLNENDARFWFFKAFAELAMDNRDLALVSVRRAQELQARNMPAAEQIDLALKDLPERAEAFLASLPKATTVANTVVSQR